MDSIIAYFGEMPTDIYGLVLYTFRFLIIMEVIWTITDLLNGFNRNITKV